MAYHSMQMDVLVLYRCILDISFELGERLLKLLKPGARLVELLVALDDVSVLLFFALKCILQLDQAFFLLVKDPFNIVIHLLDHVEAGEHLAFLLEALFLLLFQSLGQGLQPVVEKPLQEVHLEAPLWITHHAQDVLLMRLLLASTVHSDGLVTSRGTPSRCALLDRLFSVPIGGASVKTRLRGIVV